MTKKRKRQDDFQKVKLKVGKRKPKADNVTNTKFKTRAIHVPQQLKSDASLPTNHRKLNIKDLLTQLHHYSSGIKQSALIGLKDLVSQHPSVITSHLSNILSDVAAVFTDKDPTVRSATVQLLNFLAPRISGEQMAPFYPLVCAHLSSAMTHIVEGIQEDALKILDVLLEHYPELLTDHSSILLKNFLELISHQKLTKELKAGGKISCWMLSVNPNRRVTSQQWRLNVLSRLRKFLQAIVEGSSQSVENEAIFETDDRIGSEHVTTLQVSWENYITGQQRIQLYEHSGSQPSTVIPFRLRPLDTEGLSSLENLKGFVQILVPLLLDCWMEASQAQLTGAIPSNLLEPEAMNLKLQVLSIIQLLWKLMQRQDESQKLESWLRNHYLSDFKDQFIKNFPYSVLETAGHKKKDGVKKDKQAATFMNNTDHPLALNLALCQVMVSLTSALTVHLDADWLEQIRKFVSESLSDGRKLTSQQLNGMLMLVWRLVLVQCNRGSTEELLRAVYTQYQQQGLSLAVRTMLLNFFSGLYLREKTSNLQFASRCCTMGRVTSKLAISLIRILHTRSSFGGWTCSLPESLVNDVNYFSFLFSTLTGFSGEELTWLQSSTSNPHISQSQFSSVRLYVTDLDQFAHHWALTEVICQCLSAIPSRIQCCDILQSAICKHLVSVHLLPDSTAGSILKAVGQLIDPAFIPNECLLNFLAECCYSILYFILTLERNSRGNAQKRELLWGSCLTALVRIPRLLRLMLQSLRVTDTCQEELPVVAQILRLLLQQVQLRQHMVANAALVQQVIQDITNFKAEDFQEQWLIDLHYCFRLYLTTQHRNSANFTVTY
ncbi:hypothetical protein chiPu_0003453 [Chiloscyllium punctatum]|uniref:Uncharacterized protein n=1 Tax=Chiloscyllium punctatum TaxID=137246 RepID=A0A401S3V5_CHIPU|nr:hypothetical protein [Chiloscyllium punctatum]